MAAFIKRDISSRYLNERVRRRLVGEGNAPADGVSGMLRTQAQEEPVLGGHWKYTGGASVFHRC